MTKQHQAAARMAKELGLPRVLMARAGFGPVGLRLATSEPTSKAARRTS